MTKRCPEGPEIETQYQSILQRHVAVISKKCLKSSLSQPKSDGHKILLGLCYACLQSQFFISLSSFASTPAPAPPILWRYFNCTLHNAHYILRNKHWTQHMAYFTLNTSNYILPTKYYTNHTKCYTLHTLKWHPNYYTLQLWSFLPKDLGYKSLCMESISFSPRCKWDKLSNRWKTCNSCKQWVSKYMVSWYLIFNRPSVAGAVL